MPWQAPGSLARRPGRLTRDGRPAMLFFSGWSMGGGPADNHKGGEHRLVIATVWAHGRAPHPWTCWDGLQRWQPLPSPLPKGPAGPPEVSTLSRALQGASRPAVRGAAGGRQRSRPPPGTRGTVPRGPRCPGAGGLAPGWSYGRGHEPSCRPSRSPRITGGRPRRRRGSSAFQAAEGVTATRDAARCERTSEKVAPRRVRPQR